MPAAIGFPFLRPLDTRMTEIGWFTMPNGIVLPEFLADWDPNTDLTIRCDLELDVEGIREDCKLLAGDELSVGLSWHSEGTSLRGRGELHALQPNVTRSDVALTAIVPGSKLAGRLSLQANLFLSAVTSGRRSPIAPSLLGSVLWARERQVLLEGIGSRFPIEIVSFENSTWPSGAAWCLEWDPVSPENSLLGTVRLLVNSANPRVVAAIKTSQEPTADANAIRSAMFFDVGRTLVRAMLECDEFRRELKTFTKGTVGRHVASLISVLFPGESIDSLRIMAKERPAYFDSRLQERLKLFSADTDS